MTDPSRPRAVAINVGANTQLPGVRGPVYPDGQFAYVPIPEREPTDEPVPTYGDLDLPVDLPPDRRVHLDPEFAGVHGRTAHTYGDEHGVKAGPLSRLDPGDFLLFYATLSFRAGSATGEGASPDAAAERAPFVLPDWGAYLIGGFRVARAVTGDEFRALPAAERERFASNAHLRRAEVDAKVLVRGDDRSRLYDRAVPLSGATGSEANWIVTDLSDDSGKGPWWRRVLRFDPDATAELRRVVDDPERVVRDGRFGEG